MRTITGRFITAHNGKPAAYGNLHLELDDEEDNIENVVPLGELAESLKIPLDEEYRKEWREEQRNRGGWSDEEIAEQEAIEFKQKYNLPHSYDFTLDRDGRIPLGTQIIGNDELTGDTSYRITVTALPGTCTGFNPVCFKETLRITGDAPVNLNEIVPRKPKVDPDAHLSPRERDLKAVDAAIVRDGRAKFGKNNRIGFFAGIIHCPTSRTESVSLPCLENGRFGVFPFSLPFPAVVNRVSILVDRAGEGTVLIGIYDASGKKRCEVAVDISRMGPAIGIFPNTVNISEGDYFLTWGSDTKCDAELRGIGVIDQLNLLNASGTALMGSARSQPGRTLPDTLGVITPNSPSSEYRPNSIYGPTYAPILAYFKG